MTDIDWAGCSIVQTNSQKMGGLPTVRALRLTADAVVENHDGGVSEREIAYQFQLPIKDVRIILAYAEQYRKGAHPIRP